MKKNVIILSSSLVVLLILYFFSIHTYANTSALNITYDAPIEQKLPEPFFTINGLESRFNKNSYLLSLTTPGNDQTNNTEGSQKTQYDVLKKVLFELIGPTFGTFLGIIIATKDSRKKAKKDEEEKKIKSKNIKNMLNIELCHIQNTVRGLNETQYYDYLTPTWNVIKETNIIDYLTGEELNSYISKYTTLLRASHLEKDLYDRQIKGADKTDIQLLSQDVMKMRQYIANGFVVVDYPGKVSEENDG